MTENNSIPRRVRNGPTDEELKHAIPRGQLRREVQVGFFVLLALLSLLAALFLLTDPATFRGRYKVTTLVVDAGGIRAGDPVQMRGVNIGRVHGFTMAREGVLITLELEGKWRFPADSRTRLASGGILGGRTVEIIEGSNPELARGGAQLPGEKVEGILDLPAELGQEARITLDRIQALLAEPTVEAVQEGAIQLRALLGDLSELTRSQGGEIARLTESLNRSADGIEEAIGSGEELGRVLARADSTLLQVRQAGETLRRSSSALEVILARVERGEGTLGKLSTDPSLFEAVLQATESLRLLAEDVRANPGRYVQVRIF